MKFHHSTLLTILACVGMATAAFSADDAPPPAMHGGPNHMGPGHMGHGHMHGPMMGGPFMHVVHQLDLTAEQKQSIHSIMDAQHAKAKATMGAKHANMEALANPGDPNYPAAIAAAKTDAANMVQNRSDIEVQIYALLTTEQKAQLPKVLADMKAKHEQRRASRLQGAAQTKAG